MRNVVSIVALAASMAATGSALAQEASGGAADDGGTAALAEIVVTAQKRSENLQNVPIAVSAISASALESKGVAGVLDLQQVVPNLNISNSNGVVNTSLRGVGSNSIAPGFENSVATYIDGVYIASQVASFTSLSNIAQIAVLKGPQGTLFGRNATGGVLQITTREPTGDTVIEGTLGYANYETVSGTAYLSGGITPNLSADFAFYGMGMGEGYGKSVTTGHDLYRTKHDITLRSKWVWTPSDATKITLIGDYSDSSHNLNTVYVVPGTISGYDPAAGPAADTGYDNTSEVENFVKGWAAGGALIIDQEIGSLSLTSISAYRESSYSTLFDFDGTSVQGGVGAYKWPDQQFSQELQLQSDSSGRFKWTVGGYYYHGKTAYAPVVLDLYTTDLPFYDPSWHGTQFDITARLRTNSIAGFAQATYEVVPDTNLTLGLRYTHEEREAYDQTTAVAVINPGIPLGVTPSDDDKVTFNKLTFRIAVDHRFSDQVLGYASFNRGFKSGGFNLSNPGTPAYRPETLDAYEVGLKTDLFDRRLRVNIAGFYNKFDDVQSQVLDTVRGGIILVVNAAKATTYGLDLDFQAQITPDLQVTGGLGLVSAKYDSYPDAVLSTPQGGTPVTFGSAKGNRLPLASPVTANLGLNYNVPISSGSLTFVPSVSYNGGQYFESDNSIKQKKYALVNAQLRWESDDEKFNIAIFAKNITDKSVKTFVATTPNGTHVTNLAAPRTYGITAGFKY